MYLTYCCAQYHILVIISDGRIKYEDSVDAIVEASKWPISIILVGVGDGPWSSMREFDDALHASGRRFDNFQFVDFDKVTRNARNPEAAFALHALMEIPGSFTCSFSYIPTRAYTSPVQH